MLNELDQQKSLTDKNHRRLVNIAVDLMADNAVLNGHKKKYMNDIT